MARPSRPASKPVRSCTAIPIDGRCRCHAFYERAAALDLAGGDETGMWMLNYPFPYTDRAVGAAHATASQALADALAARGTRGFAAAARRYLAARRAFAAAAGPRHWRYADFQLWHGGVARWSEIVLGEQFPDRDLAASATALRNATIAQLRTPDPAKTGREFAYSYGASESMLLDACDREWRSRYTEQLGLSPLVERAIAHCR